MQVATSLNNLGILSYAQGKDELAESSHQRGLQIQEQALGPHHPQVAYTLNNLSVLYLKQGKYALAEPLLQRALHIWEQVLGLHHPLIAYSLNGQANLFREQGRYEQAEALYQRALSLRQEPLGPQRSEVAETLQDQARLRQMQQHLTGPSRSINLPWRFENRSLEHSIPKPTRPANACVPCCSLWAKWKKRQFLRRPMSAKPGERSSKSNLPGAMKPVMARARPVSLQNRPFSATDSAAFSAHAQV